MKPFKMHYNYKNIKRGNTKKQLRFKPKSQHNPANIEYMNIMDLIVYPIIYS